MNSEYDLFPGARPIYPAGANGFDPLKAQFRRAEIYKLALENLIEAHNSWVKPEGCDECGNGQYDIDTYINNAKIELELKNGK